MDDLELKKQLDDILFKAKNLKITELNLVGDKMDNKYQVGNQEPIKVEPLKLDSERLEIVKEILEQNKKILDFILEPPAQLMSNVSNFHIVSKTSGSDIAKDISERIENAMR